MLRATVRSCGLPHVVVVGNQKGGSGKTTIAMHVALALLRAGQRVATIDLDRTQNTLTHYIANRRAWARRTGRDLELPDHFAPARLEGEFAGQTGASEYDSFERTICRVQHDHDFVVIDMPPRDGALIRLVHAMTDTLVTPINDSFVDLDALAAVDPVTFAVTDVGRYAELVREARRGRRSLDGTLTDWVVVRNRLPLLGPCMQPALTDSLGELALRIGFRVAEGFADRAIYREFFPRGLTALDDAHDVAPFADPDSTRTVMQQEVEALVHALQLPIGQSRTASCPVVAIW